MTEVDAVVDYGMGNLHSVRHALVMAGADDVVVTHDPAELAGASRIVLPGVGAFGECVKNLRASGLLETLENEVRKKGKPMLGICLGMQVLASSGEEMGEHEGLGWIPGRVKHLDVGDTGLRVPHVGWNEIVVADEVHPIFTRVRRGATFYFVHSYAFVPDAPSATMATCDYGGPFTCAVAKDTVVATQFHPEKSQQNGLAVLESFLEWKP
jgi:glutamine amidotransferase